METTTYPIGEGFNSVVNLTDNCKVVPPAYEIGHSSKKFFLGKREGLAETHAIVDGGQRLLSFSDDINPEVALALTGSGPGGVGWEIAAFGDPEEITYGHTNPTLLELDASHVLVIGNRHTVGSDNTNAYACVYEVNTTTGALTTLGTPFRILTSLSTSLAASLIDATHVLVVVDGFSSSGRTTLLKVLEIDTGDWSLSVVGAELDSGVITHTSRLLFLDESNHFIWGYRDIDTNDNFVVTALSVNLSTWDITLLDTPLVVESNNYTRALQLQKIDADHILVVWSALGSFISDTYAYARALEVDIASTWAVTVAGAKYTLPTGGGEINSGISLALAAGTDNYFPLFFCVENNKATVLFVDDATWIISLASSIVTFGTNHGGNLFASPVDANTYCVMYRDSIGAPTWPASTGTYLELFQVDPTTKVVTSLLTPFQVTTGQASSSSLYGLLVFDDFAITHYCPGGGATTVPHHLTTFSLFEYTGGLNLVSFTGEDLTQIHTTYPDLIAVDHSDTLDTPTNPVAGAAGSGTATGGGNPSGPDDAFLEDTGQTWTVNAYAGLYIWVKSGDGAGDIQLIKGNSATKIYVYGWTNATAPSSGSTYGLYGSLAHAPMFSSTEADKTYFFDGIELIEIPSVRTFQFATVYDGRAWYADSKQPSLYFYSEVGQPFKIASFIDTGANAILSHAVFGDYLVFGTSVGIRCVKKDVTADAAVVYNTADLVSGLGVFGERSIKVTRSGCYCIGSNRKIYTLSVQTKSETLAGEIKNVSDVLGGYWRDYAFDLVYMLQTPDELIVVAQDVVGGTTRFFKFNDTYQGWLVDSFAVLINDYQFVGGVWYLITGVHTAGSGSIATLTNLTGEDLGTAFTQRVGFLCGMDTVFAPKNLHSLKALFEFSTTDYVSVRVEANGAYSRGISNKNLGGDPDASTLGENPFGEVVFGGEGDTGSGTGIQIRQLYINRSGNYFQIIFSDEAQGGFTIGDIKTFTVPHSELLGPKVLAV